MSTALTGPLEAIGQDMRLGVETYFARINRQGGINGALLKLIVRDDQYEPGKAAHNMRELIDSEEVLAIVGNAGTPTAIVSLPIAIEKQILYFGALSGAGLLRQPEYQPYVVNFRASYADETAVMIKGLLSMGIKPEEIAFFSQYDGFGDDGYQGAIKALSDAGFKDVDQLVHGRYTRNTTNVYDAVSQLLDAEIEPKAVIMIGSYEPSAKFIQLSREDLPELLFLNVSFVGSNALKEALGEETENVIITQVVPPYDSLEPIAEEYRAELERFSTGSEPSFVSFEGYLSAKLFVERIAKIETTVTRGSIVDIFKNTHNIEDLISKIHGSRNDNLKRVWPTSIHDQQLKPYKWTEQ